MVRLILRPWLSGLALAKRGPTRSDAVRLRVALAVRACVQKLESPARKLEAWELHHLILAATYGRLGMESIANDYICKTLEPHGASSVADDVQTDGRCASIAQFELELKRLER